MHVFVKGGLVLLAKNLVPYSIFSCLNAQFLDVSVSV